jgi:lysozyme
MLDYAGAAEQFLVWDKAIVNGKKVSLRGLTRRRKAEQDLFLKG